MKKIQVFLKSNSYVLILLALAVIFLGIILIFQFLSTESKNANTKKVSGSTTTVLSVSSTNSVQKATSTASTHVEGETDNKQECSLKSYIKSEQGVGGNGKPSIKEYVVPVACDTYILFERKDDPQNQSEIQGTFAVYYVDSRGKTYIFDHSGSVYGINGGTWEVIENNNFFLHIRLNAGTDGSMISDYYIIKIVPRLDVGIQESGRDIKVITEREVYTISLRSSVEKCKKETDTFVTDAIIVNKKVYSLAKSFAESCEAYITSSLGDYKTLGLDSNALSFEKHTVKINVPFNDYVEFDYTNGELYSAPLAQYLDSLSDTSGVHRGNTVATKSPNGSFYLVTYGYGDSAYGVIYTAATGETHPVPVGIAMLMDPYNFRWLEDGRLEVYEGCVKASACKQYWSINSSEPWKMELYKDLSR